MNIYKNASVHDGGTEGVSHDYAVIVAPGVVFYTGGFETKGSLMKFLPKGVYGTFDQDAPEYWETRIPSYLAIVDLRGNTDTGGAA